MFKKVLRALPYVIIAIVIIIGIAKPEIITGIINKICTWFGDYLGNKMLTSVGIK